MFTQDEIIEMARLAGFEVLTPHEWVGYTNSLEAFAKLVAAAAASKEREKLKNVAIFDRWYQELDAAVLAEREACAKVCDDIDKSHWGCEVKASWCSDAIRARGETTLRGET